MRPIDADALKKKTKAPDKNNFTVFVEEVLNGLIDEAPTIDAVPVVRCVECRYGITAHGISDGWVLCSKPYTERGNAMHRADWFCADGEREVQE